MSTATCEPEVLPKPAAAPISFSRMAPVFLVDRIEPCLDFWVERLGFELRVRVDDPSGLEFVTLGRDDVEVMYRTRSSVNAETPGIAQGDHGSWVVLYLEVDNLDDLVPKLEGLDVVIPLRQTPFGTQEIFVNEPSGRIVAITSRYAEAA